MVKIITKDCDRTSSRASAQAREEFPDFNVEERSAVSIARRLQDPLAELISHYRSRSFQLDIFQVIQAKFALLELVF